MVLIMFTDKTTEENFTSLKEQFLKELKINIEKATFQKTESILREKLQKEIKEGRLF